MKISPCIEQYLTTWCRDAAALFRQNDPDVGIFPNEEMAEAFDGLTNLVEDMSEGEVGPVTDLQAKVAELETKCHHYRTELGRIANATHGKVALLMLTAQEALAYPKP